MRDAGRRFHGCQGNWIQTERDKGRMKENGLKQYAKWIQAAFAAVLILFAALTLDRKSVV